MPIDLYRENAIAIESDATQTVVMCTTSQCKLRSIFRNLRVRNVIYIVTWYTLPPFVSTRSGSCDRSDPDIAIKAYILGLYIRTDGGEYKQKQIKERRKKGIVGTL